MAGLFSMPSPEAVRQQTRQGLFNQALATAQAPRGRGFVQAASQAGGLFGEALGRAAGGQAPGEDEAMRFQQVQAQIQEKYQGQDLSDPRNQIKMMGDSAQLLGKAGFQAQAVQAMDMANQIRASLPKAGTRLSDLQEIPGAPEGTLGQQRLDTGEWEIKVRPDKPQTVVNVGEKEASKYSFNKLSEADVQAGIGRNTINNLDFIDQTMKGIETGQFTNVKVTMGKIAKSFGLPAPDDIPNLEAANSSMGDLVMGVLGKFSGAISNAEREFAASIVPKLTQTKEGREEISKFMRKMANRAIEYNKQMAKYMSDNDNILLPQGKESFAAQWDRYRLENPVFTEETHTGMTDDEFAKRKAKLGF